MADNEVITVTVAPVHETLRAVVVLPDAIPVELVPMLTPPGAVDQDVDFLTAYLLNRG